MVPENDPIPVATIAMQTFDDFLGFNPRPIFLGEYSFDSHDHSPYTPAMKKQYGFNSI